MAKLKNISTWLLSGFAVAILMTAVVDAIQTKEKTLVPEVVFPPVFSVGENSLAASAAVVWEPESKRVLYAKNGEMQLPLASLTKLMAAEIALSLLSATSTIVISADAVKTEGDSGLMVGDTWQLGELVRFALTVSSNDAVAAVAGSVGDTSFVSRMNARAQELGLSQSYFLDPTGLDLTGSVSGAYGSALDIAKLAGVFYEAYPSYMESTVHLSSLLSTSTAPQGGATATPLFDIPGLIGAKTGYTDLAGGNLVAIFDVGLGRPVVAAVLHSSRDGRFSDMRTLIEAARTAARTGP